MARARMRSGTAESRLRFAVVGLGYVAQNAMLPAFTHARGRCQLTGLVSGTRAKLEALSKRYKVGSTWSYDDYDAALASDAFDAVYIALPNHLHREYAVRAAEAGKHVLCEKPMALSVQDCDTMIEAARATGVRLMVAYRLHFDPVNLWAVEIARSGQLGELHAFTSSFATPVRPGNIRVRRETGGGTLWDIGIYCVNAARYLFREEPVEVCARSSSVRRQSGFEVEEMTSAILRFPDGRLAQFWTSFVSADEATYTLHGSRGRLRVDAAYDYAAPRNTTLVVDDETTRRRHPVHDQFAAELLYFADCVKRGTEPVPSGREGRTDVAILTALDQSVKTGEPVTLEGLNPGARPGPELAITRPALRHEPELIAVTQPHP
jgi:glucose-fructose oxidoreductase